MFHIDCSFNLDSSPVMCTIISPHFIGEETEAQRGCFTQSSTMSKKPGSVTQALIHCGISQLFIQCHYCIHVGTVVWKTTQKHGGS